MESPNCLEAPEVDITSSIIIAVSIFMAIVYLKRTANVIPSVISCLLRWKESINLEDSVKLRRDRNTTAVILVLPFLLTVCHLGLIAPDFAKDLNPLTNFLLTAGILAAYAVLRIIFHLLFRPKILSKKISVTAYMSFFTFFIFECLLVFCTTGVCNLVDCENSLVRNIVLFESVAVFLLFCIRKTQIFSKYCSSFKAILYLCALEILPATLLVSAAIFL